MRKRDLHILTSSIHTYTGDARFSVRHPEHSDDWDLRIEYVQKRDAGVYECQVNTEPKINMAIMLNVEGMYTLLLLLSVSGDEAFICSLFHFSVLLIYLLTFVSYEFHRIC